MNRNRGNENGFMLPPSPINLDAPDNTPHDDFNFPKRRQVSMPYMEESGVDPSSWGYSSRRPNPDLSVAYDFERHDDRSNGYPPPRSRRSESDPPYSRDREYASRRRQPPAGYNGPRPGRSNSPRNSGSVRSAIKKRPPFKSSSVKRVSILTPLVAKIATFTIAGAAICIVAFVMLNQIFTDNALAVFMDGDLVGYVAIVPEYSSEAFHDAAVLQLQFNRGGANVQVNERVTVEPARVSRDSHYSTDQMNSLLAHRFTYQIMAIHVYVLGVREAILRSNADLNELERLLQSRHINSETVHAEFVNDWDPREVWVSSDGAVFDDVLTVADSLSRPVHDMATYTVRWGDTLHRIALFHNTTMERIINENYGLTIDTILQPGMVFNVPTMRPLMTVRTTDEIERVVPIEIDVEVRVDSNLAPLERQVLVEGTRGEQIEIERIVRENGQEISRETIPGQIIQHAVNRLEVVGPSN